MIFGLGTEKKQTILGGPKNMHKGVREHQPALNTKDEFKERQLRIKV